ncbi:MAG: amidase [Proteobacteria bacterium]|nr:amidase [Pseudomonadota bacterium]
MFDKSLKDLARALRDGGLTSAVLVEQAMTRQAQFADLLRAYKSVDPEITRLQAAAADRALAAGRDIGPLTGLPVSVKDLFGVEGFPTYAGTAKRLPADWEREGPIMTCLRSQHGVVTGKTHTVEIAFGVMGTNPHWGAPRNPWDADNPRVSGGSSSGAGVSLAEGSATLALGTDTAGSVRVPASFTGVVGLKTTQGRWSIDGIFPLSSSLDTPGILTRTVADAAYAFDALDGEGGAEKAAATVEPGDLTIGVPEGFFWHDCMPGISEGVRAALADLERAGVRLVTVELPETQEAYDILCKGGLAAVEVYALLTSELPQVLETLDPNVAQRMTEAKTLPAFEYIQRKRRLGLLGDLAASRLARVDALATPTVAVTPPTTDELSSPAVYRSKNLLALRNTSVVNMLGLCALSMPVALDRANMPIGLQLVVRPRADARLLGIAAAVERVLGTGAERLGVPPLCVRG